MKEIYSVSLYDRIRDGHCEKRIEVDSLEVANQARAQMLGELGAMGREPGDVDIIIEAHAHPTEYHQVGSHGNYVIATAEGVLGVWPADRDEHAFMRLEDLAAAWTGTAEELDALRDACAKYF